MNGLYPELEAAVLLDAAGESVCADAFAGDVKRRRFYILALEGYGLLEARMGSLEQGEDPDEVFITGLTSLGRGYLLELQRGCMAPGQPGASAGA